ncbi:hypothetical protein TNCV_4475101 [Trichonephila clavipes]|nr:hypothetical protein TNCV_4475101 [Trichonephila clavipes]
MKSSPIHAAVHGNEEYFSGVQKEWKSQDFPGSQKRNSIAYQIGDHPMHQQFVSNADCFAVGSGLESRRRHGCLETYDAYEEWGPPVQPYGVLPQNWGRDEPNCTVTCKVLKAG